MNKPKQPLCVLLAEDNPIDSQLVVHELRRAGFEPDWERVDSEVKYLDRLRARHFDIILSDYEMPGFGGPRALALLHECGLEMPFIIISGTIGEDIAVEMIKLGAADYLLKDRLTRLGPAVTKALHEARLCMERKQTEAALRESEERFRQLADNVTDVFWMISADLQETHYVSPAYEKVWGRPVDGVYADPLQWGEAILEEDRERVLEMFSRLAADERSISIEYRILRPDGTIRWILSRGFQVRDAAGVLIRITGIASDITQRKQAENVLREQAAMLDQAHDAIIVRDLHTRKITFWNQGAERLYGWTAAEATGRDVGDLLYLDPTIPDTVTAELLKAGEWRGENCHVTKTGKKLTVSGHVTLVRDTQGTPKSALTINIDVTEQKELEARYLRAQRMEGIGTLAGGIAHDLNNSLAPIMLSLELLKMKFTDVGSQELLEIISASAQRGADMVRQVLSFGRGVEGRRIEVQVKRLVHDVQQIATDTFLKHIEVRTTIPHDLWAIVGDPTQLHQVLLNLCVNARDAMPDGGTLTISAENLALDAHYAGLNSEAKPGPYILLQVEDSGTGMPPSVLEKIFEPFFTTKEIGKGTGLGLSTSLGIIKSHGGFIRVESTPEKGTKFQVYLPAQTETSMKAPAEVLTDLPRGHDELILVMDDESAVCQITQRTLEAFGYRVIVAANGVEALALYATRRTEIAVVLTDMMMPVMDGPATIRVLREMNPAVRIIAASGLAGSDHAAQAKRLGVKHFLPKPYTAETLLKALRETLED
jgi:PAS domain S-box-containing protein